MTYIPSYIKQTISRSSRDKITAARWNEIMSLLISQGDFNAETLYKLISTGEISTFAGVELAGVGRSNETVKANADAIGVNQSDIATIKGPGYVSETIKGNATSIASIIANYATSAALATKEAELKSYTDAEVTQQLTHY